MPKDSGGTTSPGSCWRGGWRGGGRSRCGDWSGSRASSLRASSLRASSLRASSLRLTGSVFAAFTTDRDDKGCRWRSGVSCHQRQHSLPHELHELQGGAVAVASCFFLMIIPLT